MNWGSDSASGEEETGQGERDEVELLGEGMGRLTSSIHRVQDGEQIWRTGGSSPVRDLLACRCLGNMHVEISRKCGLG